MINDVHCTCQCRKDVCDLSLSPTVRFRSNISLPTALKVDLQFMTSDDDLPLVSPPKNKTYKHRRTKAPKPKLPRSTVEHDDRPPRFSKYLDMHAKEGAAGFTASEDEISEDDRDHPDLSCVTSDEGSPPSDHMHSVYHQSMSSQAAIMGFGTPMYKKRVKEQGYGNGSIFDSIVEKDNKRRERKLRAANQQVPNYESLLDIRSPLRAPSQLLDLRSPLRAPSPLLDLRSPFRAPTAAAVNFTMPLLLAVSSPSRGASHVSNEQRFNRLKKQRRQLQPCRQPGCDKSPPRHSFDSDLSSLTHDVVEGIPPQSSKDATALMHFIVDDAKPEPSSAKQSVLFKPDKCDKSQVDKLLCLIATTDVAPLNLGVLNALNCATNKQNSPLKFNDNLFQKSPLLNAKFAVEKMGDKSPSLKPTLRSHSHSPGLVAVTPDSSTSAEAKRRLKFESDMLSTIQHDVTHKNVETQTTPRSSNCSPREERLTLKQLREELKAFAMAFGF